MVNGSKTPNPTGPRDKFRTGYSHGVSKAALTEARCTRSARESGRGLPASAGGDVSACTDPLIPVRGATEER